MLIWDTVGNSNKINVAGVDNIAPFGCERVGEYGGEMTTNNIAAATYVLFGWAADAEL
jgi:hypothetical protein